MYVCVCVCVCVYVCKLARMYVCMHVCMHACMPAPQGHHRATGGGGGVHNTPTSNTEANNPTDQGNTTAQHHRPTGGGIPTIHHAWGVGWGLRRCTIHIRIMYTYFSIFIYVFVCIYDL